MTRKPKVQRSNGAGAYELLLKAIEEGALPPGSRLVETELAQRFAISRTPVREALGRLEAQGLVNHVPHQGASVATLGYAEINELYFVREMLEGTAARLAAIHAAGPEIDILEEMVESDRARCDRPAELARSNRLFHRQVHCCARNRFLDGMLGTMRLSLVLLGGTTLAVPERAAQSVDEHAAIVACIRTHDADGAEQAARRHIRNALKARLRLQSVSR